MKNLKLIAILFLILIACEKEEILQVSVNIEVGTTIDTIYTGNSEFPMVSSESKQISELCKVKTFYQNLNQDPSYNEGIDYFIGRDTTCNGEKGDPGENGNDGKDGIDGQDGEDGKDGEDAPIPKFRIEKIMFDSLCRIYYFYKDDELLLADMICVQPGPKGDKGDKGDSDTVIIKIIEYDTIFSFDTLLIFDTLSRLDTMVIIKNIVRVDSLVKETIIIPGPIKFLPCDTIWFGDLFSPGFSISDIEFIGGNKKGATLQLFGKDNFGNISLLFDFYWDPVPDFDWTDPTTYIRSFNSPIDTALNFSSLGALVKYSAPKLLCKDNYLHLMNIRITAIKEE